MNDYKKQKSILNSLKKLFVGQEVKTPDGNGLLVSREVPYNGLYTQPEHAKNVVWFGTEKASDSSGWVNKEYKDEDLEPI